MLASGSCSTFTSHFLGMVNSYVAAGCNNNTCRDGVSLFAFLKNHHLKKKCVEHIWRTRSDWEPTKHSCLCSSHFEASSFAESLGVGKTWDTLKADAVPTLLSSQVATSVQALPQSKLLQKLTTENRGLILGGDGRADSLGHSAKYGSNGAKNGFSDQC